MLVCMVRNIPKRWGEYQVKYCAFCGRMATQKNVTGVEVCYQHIKSVFEDITCTCGSWLEQRAGKFGAYFNCLKCGNVSFAKAMEMKAITKKAAPASYAGTSYDFVGSGAGKGTPTIKGDLMSDMRRDEKKPLKKSDSHGGSGNPKEITISSRDVEYF